MRVHRNLSVDTNDRYNLFNDPSSSQSVYGRYAKDVQHQNVGYQPPQSPIVNEKQRDEPSTMFPDYITNDREFLILASKILAQIGDEDSNLNERQRSIATTLALPKLLTPAQMQQFYESLDLRMKCIPKQAIAGESHLCGVIRRCYDVFGSEMEALLEMNNGAEFRGDDESSRPMDVNESVFRTKENDTHQQDLTDHIVWDSNNLKKNSTSMTSMTDPLPSPYGSEGGSDVYDMIIDAMEKSPKKSETLILGEKVTEDENDVDDKSVASAYGLFREKSLLRPELHNRKVVSVQAPATLPENFMFEARMGDEVFMVHVPKGGVRKGEIFKSPVLSLESMSVLDPAGRTKRLVDMNSPSQQWRDNLFNIFANGILHPMALLSIFAPHMALAQIMTRMHLDERATRTTSMRSRVNFNFVRAVPVALTLLNGIFFFLVYRAYTLDIESQFLIFLYSSIPVMVADLCFYAYFIMITSRTRRILREEYNISEYFCLGFNDEIISFFFTPFVIAQMGRHTADYDTYIGTFCTKSGLSDHIEIKLPTDEMAVLPGSMA